MAETIAHSLMENLEELMSCKRDLIREEEDQIAWLHTYLQFLIAFLKDLQINFKDHEGAKNLEARIRDVVYEAETNVDLFVVNTVLKEKNMTGMEEIGVSEKTSLDSSLNLGHVKKEIEAIKTEVNEIYDKRTCSVQTVNNVGNFSFDRDTSRATNSSKWEGEEETMVGFEQETMILKEQLTGGSKQLKIISIVGMAGQGKTTLATRVYNDGLVTYYFPNTRAWITVSQEYRKRDLLLGLLSSVLQCTSDVDEISNNSDEVLAQKLYKSLKGRRYFIVMDDIWDHRAWFDLKICFPDDNNGSRIMFTSRHEHVALLSNPISFPPLSLHFLSPDESWNLLRQKIFQRETCPSELMEIGLQIAQRCEGLPLAIVVVAGILRNEEKSRERWKQVGQTLNSQLAKDQERWTKTIELSYNHLPPHLKPCFLYFAIFPEDLQIFVRKLIWLWVAEGFIRKTGTKNLENLAEEYLMDLIGRKLVFVSRRGYDDRIKACGIHDLLREFCLQKAKEEYFFQRIIGGRLISSADKKKYKKRYGTWPRSFFPFHYRGERFDCKPHYNSELAYQNNNNSKLLRVAHCISYWSPCKIELVLLKYLDLRLLLMPDDSNLPVPISNLVNLETLIFSATRPTIRCPEDELCDSVFYLPHSIRKMVKLRHVCISSDWFLTHGNTKTVGLRHIRTTSPAGIIYIESPDNLVNYPLFMDNLQTLAWIDPWSWTDVLVRSPNLRKLGLLIQECGYTDGRLSLLPNLDFLNHVQELKLYSWMIPSRNSLVIAKFPPNLTKLTLKGTRLSSGDMSTLAKLLPNLEALKLSCASLEGPCWEASGVFPKLKSLKFQSHYIQQWDVASSDDFPSLERLVFEQCPNLKKMPSEIGDILTLKTIELHRCNPSLDASAREIKEEQESQGNNGLQIKITNPFEWW